MAHEISCGDRSYCVGRDTQRFAFPIVRYYLSSRRHTDFQSVGQGGYGQEKRICYCREENYGSDLSQPRASGRLITKLTRSYSCQSGCSRALRLSRSAILMGLAFLGLSSAVSKLIRDLMPLASGRISGVRRASRARQSHPHLGQMGQSCDCQAPDEGVHGGNDARILQSHISDGVRQE
jgi:hypothetical protein